MIRRKSTTPPPESANKCSNNIDKSIKLSQKRSISPNSVASYQGKRNNNIGSRSMQTATAVPSTRTSVVSSRNF